MTKDHDFDIQASKKLLEWFSWDQLRNLANDLADSSPDLEFYPWRWFNGDRSDCPEKIKITFIEHKGRVFKVLPYVDAKGIRVISFDPNNELQGLLEGHHRMRGKE